MNELWIGGTFLLGVFFGYVAGYRSGKLFGREVTELILNKMNEHSKGEIGKILKEMKSISLDGTISLDKKTISLDKD